MGWGHWSIAAKACGFNIYGAELSESRKSFAEKNGINVIDPFKKDFDNHPTRLKGRMNSKKYGRK